VDAPAQDRVAVAGLVPRFLPPRPASPRTRDRPPPGYGVREQCLPFTAAAALGLAIPAPFSWGFCPPAEVPAGTRAFRSPVPGGCPHRVFWVRDDPSLSFERNAFAVPVELQARIGPAPLPGLSFFDRADQQDLVKLHLPYVWRTAGGVGLLFTAPVNRPRADGLGVVAGLVECDWYASPVNLVLTLPSTAAVRVEAGEMIAQAIPISAALREVHTDEVAWHRREARTIFEGLRHWRDAHSRDRAAYKRLSRSRHGRMSQPAG
jgi:hypothetical protein